MASFEVQPQDWSLIRDTAAALLFMAAGTNAYDAYSAVNSSPWTAETVGGDERKAASMKEYCYHAVIITSVYALGGAVIAKSWWPIIGAGGAGAYMYWLYMRALKRGFDEGSDWQSSRSNL
jgi:hypothetical protein